MPPPIARTVIAQSRAASPALPTPAYSVDMRGHLTPSSMIFRTIGAVADRRNFVISYWRYHFAFETRYWAGGVSMADPTTRIATAWINDLDRDVYNEYDSNGDLIGQLSWDAPIGPTTWAHYYIRFTDGEPNGCERNGLPWNENPSFQWPPNTDTAWGEAGKRIEIGGNHTTSGYSRFSGLYYDYYILYGSQEPRASFAVDDGGTFKAVKHNGAYLTGSANLDFQDDANLGKDVSPNQTDFTVGGGNVTRSTTVPPRIDA